MAGSYIRTPEIRRWTAQSVSLWHRNVGRSMESNKIVSEKLKKWHREVGHTVEAIERTRQANIGHFVSKETREKISLSAKGRKPTSGCFQGGKKHIFYGKNFSEEHKQKLSIAQLGEKSWNWKGGITALRVKLWKTKEYKLWRQKVFQRDNYTCQQCYANNGQGATVKLNAHHVKSWKNFPDLRNKLSNGLTLCVFCHRKTENYGRRAQLTVQV